MQKYLSFSLGEELLTKGDTCLTNENTLNSLWEMYFFFLKYLFDEMSVSSQQIFIVKHVRFSSWNNSYVETHQFFSSVKIFWWNTSIFVVKTKIILSNTTIFLANKIFFTKHLYFFGTKPSNFSPNTSKFLAEIARSNGYFSNDSSVTAFVIQN